ncbi:hypothetical protein ACHAXR_008175 [Thalassiosira sp. AJA248-18]
MASPSSSSNNQKRKVKREAKRSHSVVDAQVIQPKRTMQFNPIKLWRIGFYSLMAVHWYLSTTQGPFPDDDIWGKAMSYNQYENIYDSVAPKTPDAVYRNKIVGSLAALLCVVDIYPAITANAMLIYAILECQYVLTSVRNFVNHEYLFALLSVLNCCYYMTVKVYKDNGYGWIQALRGQIIVVYFYAALWKINMDWLDGTIVKGIFLSFEEQGVARNIPWMSLYQKFPASFVMIAMGGFFLDALLFLVLAFLPPGSKMQIPFLIFHGFTGFTMSQRIGYAFPFAMIMSALLFFPVDDDDEDAKTSHAKWFISQLRNCSGSSSKNSSKKKQRHILTVLWLTTQWLLPLRMPIISRMNFKHTMEGYRWSWTMMLHSKTNMHSPGLSFMTLRPKCNGVNFPNPMAGQSPFMDVHCYPYELLMIQSSARNGVVAQMFPRQMPKVANAVNSIVSPMCPGNAPVSITASYFSSTNNGPFHRIMDPSVDLVRVHEAQSALSLPLRFWYSLIDKPPSSKDEFILRGIGSATMHIPRRGFMEMIAPYDEKTNLILVDRSSCLKVDPIRLHSVNSQILLVKSPAPLKLKACADPHLTDCKEKPLPIGEALNVPAMRTILISWDSAQEFHLYEQDSSNECSKSSVEDIIIQIKHSPT